MTMLPANFSLPPLQQEATRARHSSRQNGEKKRFTPQISGYPEIYPAKMAGFGDIRETVHNPDFNSGKFAIIKSQAGLNSYKPSVKERVGKTNAIGLRATAGRYGGTFAHHDIAFEFGMWISPEFKNVKLEQGDRLKRLNAIAIRQMRTLTARHVKQLKGGGE